MEKGIIIYKTRYGATKKYVDWLIEQTKYDCIELEKAKINNIDGYDTIVLCGSIYTSNISGISFIRKNYNILKNKKLAILGVGASLDNKENFENLKNYNLKGDLKDIPLFYARGAIDEENMSFKDRLLCKMLRKIISNQDPKTYDSITKVIATIDGNKCDWTDKKYLKKLLEYINK